MKKILLSTVAAAMVTSTLMAATTQSNINVGSDINGTVQDIAVLTAPVDINVTNVGNLDGTAGNSPLAGIYYTPAIGIGVGNLITIKVDNGYVFATAGNNLYLVDANNTADSNATGKMVAAKMTDFVPSSDGKGYTEMTFKFEQEIPSGHVLPVVEQAESNDTDTIGYNVNYSLRADQGIACGDDVKLSVINSTDQSGNLFTVANAPTSVGGVVVKRALNIAYVAGTTSCPTTVCTIALPNETSFLGTTTVAANPTCPTCTPVVTPGLICNATYTLNYTAGSKGANVAVNSIDYTLTTDNTDAIAGIRGYIGTNTAADATLAGTVYSVSLTAATNGVQGNANNTVTTELSVDGTTVIEPRTFDLAVKANQTIDVDTISNFITLQEQATQLGVSYLSANPAYRSFVRVTSSAAAAIQAVVTTEDGAVSKRIDVTKADGTPVEIGANGGAVVVEAADILRSAQDAGFTGAGMRFNATLYVKTLGAVDAVAFQTADGSQRYLPVAGATGGGRN